MPKKPTVAEILERPYSRSFIPDPDVGGYTALIQEFPGCVAEGETLEEANYNLERAAESWIEGCLAHGAEIPEPAAELEVSGRVLLRMPKSVHKRAVELAATEGVSLNQFLVSAVSEKVGVAGFVENALRRLDKAIAPTLVSEVKPSYFTYAPVSVINWSSQGEASTVAHRTQEQARLIVHALSTMTREKHHG